MVIIGRIEHDLLMYPKITTKIELLHPTMDSQDGARWTAYKIVWYIASPIFLGCLNFVSSLLPCTTICATSTWEFLSPGDNVLTCCAQAMHGLG